MTHISMRFTLHIGHAVEIASVHRNGGKQWETLIHSIEITRAEQNVDTNSLYDWKDTMLHTNCNWHVDTNSLYDWKDTMLHTICDWRYINWLIYEAQYMGTTFWSNSKYV